MPVNDILIQNNKDTDTNRGPSPAIWGSCPLDVYRADPGKGIIFEPDLFNAPVFASGVSQRGLYTLQDTGVTIQGDPTAPGVLQWAGQDADNDAGVITAAGNVGTMFNISTTDQRKLWYEIGISKSSVANDYVAFFAGLTEEGMAAATNTLLATNTAALADKDLIGFHVDQADGDSIDFVYNKSGAGGVTVKIAALSAMVASTYIKLGFVWDPTAPTAKRIKVYVNNIENSTYVTGTNVSAATFPNGEELVPTIAVKVGTGSLSETFNVRLWRCVQHLTW